MSSLIGKARKPKFELHLKIYDLNNVPLVSGNSFIKWHLTHSMHAEHRGRTGKCTIANHRVDYSFNKVVPSIRMSIDKNNNLSECPMEFEILQEFAVAEKITLGFVRLNLAEYVEESEIFLKDITSPPPTRRRNNSLNVSPTSSGPKRSIDLNRIPDDGITRRYLMQDSKVNSTLKMSILLVQVDGERNFIAPPLRTAPVFGGIAGFMAPEQMEDETGPLPNLSKNRDHSELQDLYCRTLAASWARQPTELPADECIEDIFSGGNGWKTKPVSKPPPSPGVNGFLPDTTDEDDDMGAQNGTLRPSDFRRMTLNRHSRSHSSSRLHQSPYQHQHSFGGGHHHHHHHPHHHRSHSNSSDRSVSTITGIHLGSLSPRKSRVRIAREDSRESSSRDEDLMSTRSTSSLTSLTPTLGSSERGRGDSGMKRAREIPEFEVRDDLVAWSLPSGIAA